jgi:hypothetical protein
LAVTLLGEALGADPLRPNRASENASVPVLEKAPTQDKERTGGVSLTQKSVGEVLKEIERVHGVRVELDPSVDTTQPAPLIPRGMSLELRLQGLFVHYDLVFAYGPDAQTMMNRLQRVWVLRRGTIETMQVPSASSPIARSRASGTAQSGASQSPDSRELGIELQRLSELATPEARDILTRALSDNDENVRLQAVKALSSGGSLDAVDALKRMAHEDRSEVLRAQALEALVTTSNLGVGELQRVLSDAAYDPSPLVRELAQNLKQTLEPPVKRTYEKEDN